MANRLGRSRRQQLVHQVSDVRQSDLGYDHLGPGGPGHIGAGTLTAQSQRLVAHAADSAENIQQAKAAAESAIRGFYAEVGWTVTVTWVSPSTCVRGDSGLG